MRRTSNITRFPSVTNPEGLSAEELAKFPAIFATKAHPRMSDRYTFLSTADIIEPLMKEGYLVTQVAQRATRQGHRDPRYTGHVVRLRRKSERPLVGGVYPEAVLRNSHDGQSRLNLYGGFYRLVCANGMTVSTVDFPGVSIFHRGELEPILERIRQAINGLRPVLKTVEAMTHKVLLPRQQEAFVRKAASLVFDPVDFDVAVLLAARREEDKGNDLWTVFNRVQEHLTRGGLHIEHTGGHQRRVTTRGITHIRRAINLNLDLWQLAMKMVA